jgi:hypothetical protein
MSGAGILTFDITAAELCLHCGEEGFTEPASLAVPDSVLQLVTKTLRVTLFFLAQKNENSVEMK